MQQLFDAFGVNAQLLIAQAVNFGVVFVALWYFLYRPISATLEKRRKVIAKGIEDAQKAEALLAGADGEAADRVMKADTEAERIVGAAREAATNERTRIVREAEARAAQALADAEARAAESAAKAQRESEKDIARVALLAAEKVLEKRHD